MIVNFNLWFVPLKKKNTFAVLKMDIKIQEREYYGNEKNIPTVSKKA